MSAKEEGPDDWKGLLKSDAEIDEEEETTDEFDYEVKSIRMSPKSVFYTNFQSIYEDTYPAKWNDELVRLLIGLYSNPGETILDPMCGSGTAPLIACQMGRNAVGQDINPEAIRITTEKYENLKGRSHPKFCGGLTVYKEDSRKAIYLPPEYQCAQYELVVFSPPFGVKAIVGTKKQYSNEEGDITNAASYEEWRAGMKAIMKNCFGVLRPGRLMIVEIRPRSANGHDMPMDLWIQNDALEIGFERWTRFVEIYDPWRMYTTKDKENNFPKPFPGHADLLIFKRPTQAKLI